MLQFAPISRQPSSMLRLVAGYFILAGISTLPAVVAVAFLQFGGTSGFPDAAGSWLAGLLLEITYGTALVAVGYRFRGRSTGAPAVGGSSGEQAAINRAP